MSTYVRTSVSCFFEAGEEDAHDWLNEAELDWVHVRTREAVLKIREIPTEVDILVFTPKVKDM